MDVELQRVILRVNAKSIESMAPYIESYRLTRFIIWVDFAYNGNEFGTYECPYDTMAEGVAAIIPSVGNPGLPELRIKAGSTNKTITITKRMALQACGGTVRIGG